MTMARPVWNPRNPWLREHLVREDPAPEARLEVREEEPRSALSRNDSPDVPFTWSVNPYRGCQHACSYCYARPTHQYLGLGAGTDFEKVLVVKAGLPEVLHRELSRPSWKGEAIAFSGVTDPYQPLEARYGIMRRCLEVCLEHRNPVGIVTKGVLVRRDADLLAELERVASARVFVSIPFGDAAVARALEPGVPTPAERLETIAALSEAGVPVGLALAPLIPRLTEIGLEALIAGAARAGAREAFHVLLRLPAEVLEVFRERLEATLPTRARAVLGALSEMRGGRLQESRFGQRMRGSGPRHEALEALVRLSCRRHGLLLADSGPPRAPGRRTGPHQGLLFE
jgi:DNA repair photolyase